MRLGVGCLGKFHKLAKQYEQANMKNEGNDIPEYSWCCECGHKIDAVESIIINGCNFHTVCAVIHILIHL